MPLKVAFAGKGGVGKSVIAATAARLLARRGHPVLALDIDTMPGLVMSLGPIAGAGTLPEGLAERREKEGWVMKTDVDPAELIERYGATGPDGIRVLVLGKLPGDVRPDVTAAFRYVVTGFRGPGWSVVGDLAAGTRQACFGWAGFATTVVLVVEPTASSILAARRLAGLQPAMVETTFTLVASKVRHAPEARRLADAVGIPLAAVVPYDEQVVESERAGLALIDAAPDAPAVRAIGELLPRLEGRR
jgi:CO dehydrogenase maturation factor